MNIPITSLAILTTLLSAYAFGKATQPNNALDAACEKARLEAYFEVQANLANDSLDEAQKAAKSLIASQKEPSCSSSADASCADELAAVKTISNASDMAAARQAFQTWSNALISKLEAHGLASGEAFQMYCPMAFGGKGGAWLQSESKLRNPYFGSMMLHCGVKKQEFKSSATAN